METAVLLVAIMFLVLAALFTIGAAIYFTIDLFSVKSNNNYIVHVMLQFAQVSIWFGIGFILLFIPVLLIETLNSFHKLLGG